MSSLLGRKAGSLHLCGILSWSATATASARYILVATAALVHDTRYKAGVLCIIMDFCEGRSLCHGSPVSDKKQGANPRRRACQTNPKGKTQSSEARLVLHHLQVFES